MLVCHVSSIKTLRSMSEKKIHYDYFLLALSNYFFFSKNEKNIVVDGRLRREEKLKVNLRILFVLLLKCILIELFFKSSNFFFFFFLLVYLYIVIPKKNSTFLKKKVHAILIWRHICLIHFLSCQNRVKPQ